MSIKSQTKLSPGRTSNGKIPSIGFLFGDRSGILFYMKHIIFMLLLSVTVQGQATAMDTVTGYYKWMTEPEKKDNVIKIPLITFKDAKIKCLDMGYTIATVDNDLEYLVTAPITDKHGNSITLKIRVKEGSLWVCGDVTDNISISSGMFSAKGPPVSIEFRGMKGSTMRQGWELMDSFAKSFSTPVSYDKL